MAEEPEFEVPDFIPDNFTPPNYVSMGVIRLAEDVEGRNVIDHLQYEGPWPPPAELEYGGEKFLLERYSKQHLETHVPGPVAPGALYVRASNVPQPATPAEVPSLRDKPSDPQKDDSEKNVLDMLRERQTLAKQLHLTDMDAAASLTPSELDEVLAILDRMSRRIIGITQGVQSMLEEATGIIQSSMLDDLASRVPMNMHDPRSFADWLRKQKEDL